MDCNGHNDRIDKYGFCCSCTTPGKIEKKKKKGVKDFEPNF